VGVTLEAKAGEEGCSANADCAQASSTTTIYISLARTTLVSNSGGFVREVIKALELAVRTSVTTAS
jgi:hypothetical protein